MFLSIIEVVLAIIIPLLIMKLRNTKLISKIGISFFSYLCGIIVSLIIFLLSLIGIINNRDTSAIENVCYLAIAIGIPLLLFSNNLKYFIKLSRKAILSFLLLIISLLFASTLVFIIFRNYENSNILTGMAISLYSGGTPNSNAVGYIYGLDNNTILIANLSDVIIGGIFYAFLLYLSKPLLKKILKANNEDNILIQDNLYDENIKEKFSLKSKNVIRNILLSLLCVLISAGIGILLWILTGKKDGSLTNYLVPSLMIGTTLLGIMFSIIPSISKVKENNLLGQYFASIFSYSIASMLDFSSISLLSINIFLIFTLITIFTFIIHVLMCKLFKINANLMIVSSTAGIYGPAFIPSITKSIKADYLLSTGLILGSFGYAIGTFLGIGYIELLKLIF